MVFPVPADTVCEVVHGIRYVACVVNTRGLRGIIRAPNHVDESGLAVWIIHVVVEDHLEVDAIARVWEVLGSGLFQQSLRIGHAKTCAEEENQNKSRHENPR